MNSYLDLLKVEDFRKVTIMTATCNKAKLDTAINTSRILKIDSLLCYDFVSDIISKWRLINALTPEDPVPPELVNYVKLIEGGEYQDCKDKVKNMEGFKTLWIYYAYGEYTRINHFDDTPNGLVGKTNEFSMPTPNGDVNNFAFKYENMGKFVFENIKEYLCLNKDLFPKFDACDCVLSCGCVGTCGCGGTKKVTGFKFKVIKKR